MAAIFLAPVYILVNLYVLRWMFLWMGACSYLFQTLPFRILYAGIYILFSTSLLTGFLIKRPMFLRRSLKIMGNLFLGTFLYILMVILTADLGRFLLNHGLRQSWTHSRTTFVLSGAVCTLIVLGLSLYGIIHAQHIRTVSYHIRIPKNVPGIRSLKLVLLADCHFGYSTGVRQAKKLVRAVNRENPDLICIAGDIFDNEYDAIGRPEKLKQVLRAMNSRRGVYACWGNHDLNEPILAGFTFRQNFNNIQDPRMERFLSDSGITLLRDESVLIDGQFYLVGREDPARAEKTGYNRKTPAQLTGELDRSKPIFVMDHQPKELQELAEAGVDLDLCGHTHDGQMFPGNIITRLFWKNSCGHLQKDRMHNIVTSGTGIWGPAMRVGTDSEICVIHIEFTE